ncbi:ARM repeat superfamily protein [Dorcoceras hygrometricum]|uniref:ARM repeat superfamily protein n=1 Tax=Dorcoceras hygrometricum TaxID=472368 RepID=A0A2Z7D2R4_9LAMI|nr:ARM repeat superfamily protein [Dorcoceras hygrometricum]
MHRGALSKSSNLLRVIERLGSYHSLTFTTAITRVIERPGFSVGRGCESIGGTPRGG